MTNPTFEQRLQSHIDYAEHALETLRGGTLPDLSPLQSAVSLCAEIESAPPPQARAAEYKLTEMISLLDRLALEIEEYKNRNGSD